VDRNNDIYRINQLALDHWASGAAGRAAQTYLHGRGLNVAALPAPYRIGYARPRWTNLVDHVAPSDLPAAEDAGLIVHLKDGRLIDRFRDRVMFPMRTWDGQICGFTGRAVHPSANTPKYLNTSTTVAFHKSELFYGLHEAAQAGGRQPILVEGPLDALAVAARIRDGHRDLLPIATSGTALTQSHAQQLAAWCRAHNVDAVIAYDADSAGRTAAIKAGELLRAHGVHIHIAQLPDGHDPADHFGTTADLTPLLPRPAGGAVPLIAAVTEDVIRTCHRRGDPDWPETKLQIIRAISRHLQTYPHHQRAHAAGIAATVAITKAGVHPDLLLARAEQLLAGATADSRRSVSM
jgi:DNA primase